MEVKDIMNKRPIKVKKDEYILDTIRLFQKKRIRAAPVVDGDKLLGVISEKDVLDFMDVREFGSKLWLPAPFDFIEAVLDAKEEVHEIEEDFKKLKHATVKDIMGEFPKVVKPNDHISAVADIMSQYTETLVPVVDDGKLVGVITRTDLVKTLL
jgi:CBS domain-containing protein